MPIAVELSGLFAVFIVLMCVWGVLAPARITILVNRFASQGGLWLAVGLRLAIGVALWFAAPHSRAPMLLQALAILAVAAAVLLPFLGLARFKALIGWWAKMNPATQRLWCLVGVAFGGAILWALLPSAA